MNIVLDTAAAKIWVDGNVPFVFSSFVDWPLGDGEFKKIESTYFNFLDIIKNQFGEVYSICDISEVAEMPHEMLTWLFGDCLERQLKVGVKRIAFIYPKGAGKDLLPYTTSPHFKYLSFHETKESAIVELDRYRTPKVAIL